MDVTRSMVEQGNEAMVAWYNKRPWCDKHEMRCPFTKTERENCGDCWRILNPKTGK